MEILFELLSPLLEFLAELLLQVLFEWLAARGVHALKAPFARRAEASPELATIGYALYGTVAGLLSLLVAPHGFIVSPAGRIANLVVTPLAMGALMTAIGHWRRRRDRETVRLERFGYAFTFAFAMAVVRFVFAGHP